MLGGLVIASGEITSGQTNLFGCALAVGGALSMVGYLLIGRTLRARLDSISYSTAVFGISGLTLLLAAWLSGASLLAPARDVPLFLALALFPTIGGHTMFNWALRHLPASVVSTSFLGEPIGASLLAWLFLGEIPATMTLLGGSVIIVGLFLTMRSL
jgi:drug/metabolite transporter (DMT)-like permease